MILAKKDNQLYLFPNHDWHTVKKNGYKIIIFDIDLKGAKYLTKHQVRYGRKIDDYIDQQKKRLEQEYKLMKKHQDATERCVIMIGQLLRLQTKYGDK